MNLEDFNVGFINPPSPFLINQRVFVTLGILRVATSLKKKTDKVFFLDLADCDNCFSLIDEFIEKNSINVICLTATTPQISYVFEYCKYIKEKYKIKIILGGPHITLMYSSMNVSTSDVSKICSDHINEILKYVDTIVIGDGEYSIFKALLNNEKIINSELSDELFLSNEMYDHLDIDRSFIDIDSYKYEIDGKKAINIISQMGCPFNCGFCSGRNSKSFNRIRYRTSDNIIKEIDTLYKNHNYTGFMFYDDELNLNKHRFHELLDKLIEYQEKENVSFNLRGFTRSDLLTEEQAKLMFKAGFRWLLVGFESGSEKILRNMNKGCDVNKNNKCFEIARNSGLKIKALMSVGHPGESYETVNETIKWLNKVKPDETDITIISIYPGANYFNQSIKISDDILKYENKYKDNLYIRNIDFLKDSNFYKSKIGEYHSYVHTDYLSEEQIVECRDKIEKNIKEW
jgi:anaerobic magnesium-protoporphyrin IX monomethyl ester cyclase